MKNQWIILSLVVAGLISTRVGAHGQILVNGDFEANSSEISIGKVATGFDSTTVSTGPNSGDAVDVAGWQNIGGVASGDSGVQYGSPAVGNGGLVPNNSESGSYFSFQESTDPGAYQISGTTLNVGDQLTLTWYAGVSYLSPTQTVDLLLANSSAATFASSTILTPTTSSDLTLTGDYAEYTLTYTATEADAGKYIGVSFATGGTGNSYAQYDNFTLTDIPLEVPEPSTYALMFAGLGALFLRKRRSSLV